MNETKKYQRLRLIQNKDVKDKVVLIRVDHNVVKKGKIKDTSRIEASLGTIFNIVSRGGKPVLMTHVGRPKNKKTGEIDCSKERSVEPIVRYLKKKLRVNIEIPSFSIHESLGITDFNSSIHESIKRLEDRKIGAVYLPNIRWFHGEQANAPERTRFARQLASIAGIFVNDAFGSWQPHVSTFDITKYLPSYAGFLLQEEIKNLEMVLNPARPFLAVVAGSKYDTKIGPLKELHSRVDHLILGGIMNNTYLCAKYGVNIAGVPQEDIDLAMELVNLDEKENKIVELPLLIESEDFLPTKKKKIKSISIEKFKKGNSYKYILDVDPASFNQSYINKIIGSAKTILVNAVMGLVPYFNDGSRALYEEIDKNSKALQLYGGGDTIQELKNLCPGVYIRGLENPKCYYFTGGGTVLKAIEGRSPLKIKPVERLLVRQ